VLRIRIPDNFLRESKKQFLGLKILKFESGINIPDLQHGIDGIVSQEGQAYGEYMEFIDAFSESMIWFL
jgi:hypothetical protein